MANLFSKGDVVILKSGGIAMTVDRVPGDSTGSGASVHQDYRCVWFKGASRESGMFGEHLIEGFTPPKAAK